MISVLLTAYKESNTIARALKYIADPKFSGYDEEIEVIQISPDESTLKAGEDYIKSVQNSNLKYKQIIDPNKGKPIALNMAFEEATGKILVLTDGDVYFEKGGLEELITGFKNSESKAACGEVLSMNEKNSFMGYISHLMTSAAHHKRMIELNEVKEGHGTKLVTKTNFFPLSGYMLIIDCEKVEKKINNKMKIPDDCLVDDAYMSYIVYNNNMRLGYIPDAKVYAKFPTHMDDYMKQKKRSTGGYLQLWKYGVVKKETKSRSFWHELRYFWFPIKYATSFRELMWSLGFYPLRLWLWVKIWWERKIMNKDFESSWVRIESTK